MKIQIGNSEYLETYWLPDIFLDQLTILFYFLYFPLIEVIFNDFIKHYLFRNGVRNVRNWLRRRKFIAGCTRSATFCDAGTTVAEKTQGIAATLSNEANLAIQAAADLVERDHVEYKFD